MKIQLALSASLLLGLGAATLGVDFSTPLSLLTFQCFKSSGVGFAIPRAWMSYGAFDSNSISNIKNARDAGIANVDVYMFPCRGKSASQQVSDLVSHLGSSNYGKIWLDIESNPSTGCNWGSFSASSNCDYISELVQQVRSHGRVPGIYASQHMWTEILGSAGACTKFTDVPLWYAHYDGKPTFDDFSALSFGGWKKPNIKQYKGTTTFCGAGVDFSFY